MIPTASSTTLPALVSLVAALSLASVGCGTKGTDEEGGEGGDSSSGATGGTSGSGGSSGKGGSSSGTTVVHEWNFDEDLEGWALHSDAKPAALATDATLEWSNEEGEGEPVGAAKLTIPFSGQEDYVLLSFNVPADIADMSGLRLEVSTLLAAGLTEDTMNPGGAQPFAKGGEAYVWAQGSWTNLGVNERGGFITAALTFDTPTNDASAPLDGYDSANIREFGIKIGTGGMGTDYHEAIVYIDYVRVVDP